jgi:excisionase family DNA binding protein
MDTSLQHQIGELLSELKEHSIREKEVLSAHQAATYLDLSLAYLYRLTSANQIPYYKPGKKIYFKKGELDQWMLRNRKETKSEIESRAAIQAAQDKPKTARR